MAASCGGWGAGEGCATRTFALALRRSAIPRLPRGPTRTLTFPLVLRLRAEVDGRPPAVGRGGKGDAIRHAYAHAEDDGRARVAQRPREAAQTRVVSEWV